MIKSLKSLRYAPIILGLSALACGTAFGQVSLQSSPITKLPVGDYATKFVVLHKPMSVLLDQGYEIVNLAVGLGGVGYLLHHDNKWVACSVVKPSGAGQNQAISHCVALN